MRPVERRAPGGRADRQPERGIVAQRIRIVMVAPALGGEQNAGPEERGEVMDDILPAPRIGQPRDHPADDAAALHDLAQHHDTVRRAYAAPSGATVPPNPLSADPRGSRCAGIC